MIGPEEKISMFCKLTRVLGMSGVILLFILVACQAQGNAGDQVVPVSVDVEAKELGDRPALESLSRDQVLILSDISNDPANKIEAFQPMADYLATHLSDYGIRSGKVLVAPDMSTMVQYLKTGQADLFFDSPFPAFTVFEDADATPLLRRWKKGVAEYHTVIAARKDSGITEPAHLVGHIIAFDDPVSTSGFLLPKGYLTRLGYELELLPSATSAVESDRIGFVFAGGEVNVRRWVLEGKTAAAAIPSADYKELDDALKAQLHIIARTPNVPRHIALARPEMDEDLQARIVELLVSMDQTPEGQAVLAKFDETKKFDALPLGTVGTMNSFRALFRPGN